MQATSTHIYISAMKSISKVKPSSGLTISFVYILDTQLNVHGNLFPGLPSFPVRRCHFHSQYTILQMVLPALLARPVAELYALAEATLDPEKLERKLESVPLHLPELL